VGHQNQENQEHVGVSNDSQESTAAGSSQDGTDLRVVKALIDWLGEYAAIQKRAGRWVFAEELECYRTHLIRWVDSPIFGPRV